MNHKNENKKFWTTVKLLFCNKIKSVENITLDRIGKLVKDRKEVLNMFTDFFCKYSPKFRDKYQT